MTELSEPVLHEEVERAARVLVTSCLDLGSGDQLVLISDHAVPNVAEAIARVARNLGCRVLWFRLAEHGPRPFKLLPDALQSALANAQASVFIASAPHNELGMRQHLLHGRPGLRCRQVRDPRPAVRTAVALPDGLFLR